MSDRYKRSLFWFRRDLRITDNHGLYKALKESREIIPVFIFDQQMLEKIKDKKDLRVQFIYKQIEELHSIFQSNLFIHFGTVINAFEQLLVQHDFNAIYCNEDYEPLAIRRDDEVNQWANQKSIHFHSFKDQVIFAKNEIIKKDGTPYTVYSPYKNQWLQKLHAGKYTTAFPSEKLIDKVKGLYSFKKISLEYIGFTETPFKFPRKIIAAKKLKHYDKLRDIPELDSTSHLSTHLRFGTISIRFLVKKALHINDTWLSELIWREFFMAILYHHPQSVDNEFKIKYINFPWRHHKKDFDAWKNGITGYALVDAGMRELNKTGFMHNRVRMIAASFLSKHLLIDWRWGERYFSEKLLDFDLSANVGNWQWASSTGCDAVPYFRIFNPITQAKKWDPNNTYIKKWIPEYGTSTYPDPIISHTAARIRCLDAFKGV